MTRIAVKYLIWNIWNYHSKSYQYHINLLTNRNLFSPGGVQQSMAIKSATIDVGRISYQ